MREKNRLVSHSLVMVSVSRPVTVSACADTADRQRDIARIIAAIFFIPASVKD